MPPGWFIPVKRSPAKERRQEVQETVEDGKYEGKLHAFWEGHGHDAYNALVEGVSEDKIQELLDEPKLKYKGSGHHRVEIID
jgi:hypothetical protein